jgi:peptide/nickel transport system permease protein
MLRYLLRRLLYSLPIGLGVSVVCFALVHLAPGDPINAMLPENATAELVAQVKAAYGFDKPLPVQFFIWLGNVLTGDLGTSVMTRRSVVDELGPAIFNSLILASVAILMALLMGTLLGAIAGKTKNRYLDRFVTGISITGVSLPHYWLGMVLIVIFSVELNWLPASGMGTKGSTEFNFSLDSLLHLILPAITLSVIPTGIIARSVRASVSDVMKQEFIQALYAKGLGHRQVLIHVAKNAAPTVMAIMGLQFAQLMGGSILVETVFAWPGTGFLLNTAIFTRDVPILQGTILVLAMFFVFVNLLVDMFQMLVDPRVKRS